jgi:hypothetical protein
VSDYYYRGTSLSAANAEEFANGRIEGTETTVYAGELLDDWRQYGVTAGHSLEDVPWWSPEGEDRQYLQSDVGVTGGLTTSIGTAIGFSNGIPTVLYVNERKLNGRDSPVRYGKDYFDSMKGALGWVTGASVSGEIHDRTDGVVGLTTETEEGTVVKYWGTREMANRARQHQDEFEALVFEDHIDIVDAMDSVGLWMEGAVGPRNVLNSFDGYSTYSEGGDDVDFSEWLLSDILDALYREYRRRAATDIEDLWLFNLDTTLMGSYTEVPVGDVAWAYDGSVLYQDMDRVPDYLLGR